MGQSWGETKEKIGFRKRESYFGDWEKDVGRSENHEKKCERPIVKMVIVI